MMAVKTFSDPKMEPTKLLTFRSDGYVDEAIERAKIDSIVNDGVKLSTSAAIRKMLIAYLKGLSEKA